MVKEKENGKSSLAWNQLKNSTQGDIPSEGSAGSAWVKAGDVWSAPNTNKTNEVFGVLGSINRKDSQFAYEILMPEPTTTKTNTHTNKVGLNKAS